MDNIKEEVLDFLDKCEHLKTSKFIMATEGIKDILKSIVNSPALYELFHAVTNNFDYVAAKRQCFVTVTQGYIQKSYIVLPSKTSERLAFIFCLLVEFDHETLNFTEFLLQYFPEDMTCYASFHSFCDKIINVLTDIIKDVFSDELAENNTQNNNGIQEKASAELSPLEQKLTIISILITHEINVISQSAMTQKDKDDGICILTELDSAMKEGRLQSVKASLCGYDYFTRCHGDFSNFLDLLSAEIN